jgi:hypothetical protein
MMPHELCMVCHDKHFHTQLEKINQLDQMIRRYNLDIEDQTNRIIFPWFINKRCQFGMHCTTLSFKNNEALAKARKLDPYLQYIAESNDATLYHNTLNLLRGNFPSVYRRMEELHTKSKALNK